MIILGIDPAYSKPNAITEIEDGLVLGFFKSDDLSEIMQSVERADKVFIEDQYFKMNPNITLRLGQATGKLMALCELNNVPCELVYPGKWMNYFGITTRRPKGMTSYFWYKKHYKDIIDKAQEYTSLKLNDEDEAASLLIGMYGLKND